MADATDVASDRAALNAASGIKSLKMKFGDKEVPISETELLSLERKLAQYVSEFGSDFGFVSWLLERA